MGAYGTSLPLYLHDLSLMYPSEVNVAYNGTSADLGASDTALFESFSWDDICSSTDSLPATGGFTAVNGTVSPQDVLLNDASGSVPPSTAFTNLTTPGSALLDTPNDSFETSPMFEDSMIADLGHDDQWFSLFPDDKPSPSAPVMSRTISSGSQVVVHPGGESRKRSSVHASPLTASTRPSSVSGVHKREKILPPIVVDEGDTVALKRARNTAAARKSRDKKVKERETLESRISELESEVEHWKALALAKHPHLDLE